MKDLESIFNALHNMVEDMFFKHMDDVFTIAEPLYKDSYQYKTYYAEITVSKIGDDWKVTSLQ